MSHTKYKREYSTVKFLERVFDLRDSYLEELYAAFIKKTNIPADRVELVQDLNLRGEIIFYFRKRENDDRPTK